MLTCREIPEVLDDYSLSFSRRLQLNFHLVICQRCRALKKQFAAIRRNLHRYVNKSEPLDPKVAEKIVFNYLNDPNKK